MSEHVVSRALACGGVLLEPRSLSQDIATLAQLEAQRWDRINRRLRGPVAMAGPNLSNMAANADPGITDASQAGVVGGTDFLVSNGAVAANGNFTCNVGAGVVWVPDNAGLLHRTVRAAGGAIAALAPPGLPASGSTQTYMLRVDPNGAFSLVAAGAAIVGNVGVSDASFMPGNGYVGLANVSIYNNGGTYQLSTAQAPNFVQGTNWFDRRPWARGFFDQIVPTFVNSVNNVWATTTAGMRVECSGVPLRCEIGEFEVQLPNAPVYGVHFGWSVDGAVPAREASVRMNRAAADEGIQKAAKPDDWLVGVAPGSHLIALWAKIDAGAVEFNAFPDQLTIYERVSQSANNGST